MNTGGNLVQPSTISIIDKLNIVLWCSDWLKKETIQLSLWQQH